MLGFTRFHPTMSAADIINVLNSNFAVLEQDSANSSSVPYGGGAIGDLIRTSKTIPTANRLFMNGGTYKKDEYPDLWDLHTLHPGYFASSTSTTFTLATLANYEVIAKLR